MQAGIVDYDSEGPVVCDPLHCIGGGLGVAEIELHGPGPAAFRSDGFGGAFGPAQAAGCMYDHLQTLGSQAMADRPAKIPGAPGDQGTAVLGTAGGPTLQDRCSRSANLMVARPWASSPWSASL